MNTLEINQISAGTWNYAKVLLSGLFDIFHLSLVTVYQQDQGNDQKHGNATKIIGCASPAVERSDDIRDNTQRLYPPFYDEDVTLAFLKQNLMNTLGIMNPNGISQWIINKSFFCRNQLRIRNLKKNFNA